MLPCSEQAEMCQTKKILIEKGCVILNFVGTNWGLGLAAVIKDKWAEKFKFSQTFCMMIDDMNNLEKLLNQRCL